MKIVYDLDSTEDNSKDTVFEKITIDGQLDFRNNTDMSGDLLTTTSRVRDGSDIEYIYSESQILRAKEIIIGGSGEMTLGTID